jgi:hypothetical protein
MPLHALAPDQRAVVQLVLQRERSYAQIAELLSISEDAVRARAHAGLSALAPEVELPADKLAQVADFLLGQQNGKPRQATRRMLRSSNGAREWAETVRAQLVDVGGATVPELPAQAAAKGKAAEEAPAAEEASAAPVAAAAPDASPTVPDVDAEPAPDTPAPRPRPLRDKPRTRSGAGPTIGAPGPGAVAAASSRLGGAVLIGLAVLAIVVVVLVLFVFNGDDGGDTADRGTPTPTPTATAAQPNPVGQIELTGTGAAAKAKGVLALYLQGEQQLVFALQVQGTPPTPKGTKYALWLSGPGTRAKWIGDVPDVGKDGVLQVQGPRADDKTFTQDIGSYRQVLVTRQTGSGRKRPGATLVRGDVPRA